MDMNILNATGGKFLSSADFLLVLLILYKYCKMTPICVPCYLKLFEGCIFCV